MIFEHSSCLICTPIRCAEDRGFCMWNCMVLLYCHRLWNIIEGHNTNYQEYWENLGSKKYVQYSESRPGCFQWMSQKLCNSEVFATVLMKIKVFSVVTPCQLVISWRHFGEASCLHLQGILYYHEVTSVILCVISGFRHTVDDMCAFLRYVACSYNSITKELLLHAAWQPRRVQVSSNID